MLSLSVLLYLFLLVLYVLYLDSALQGGAPFALRWRAAASFLLAGGSVYKERFKAAVPHYRVQTARIFSCVCSSAASSIDVTLVIMSVAARLTAFTRSIRLKTAFAALQHLADSSLQPLSRTHQYCDYQHKRHRRLTSSSPAQEAEKRWKR